MVSSWKKCQWLNWQLAWCFVLVGTNHFWELWGSRGLQQMFRDQNRDMELSTAHPTKNNRLHILLCCFSHKSWSLDLHKVEVCKATTHKLEPILVITLTYFSIDPLKQRTEKDHLSDWICGRSFHWKTTTLQKWITYIIFFKYLWIWKNCPFPERLNGKKNAINLYWCCLPTSFLQAATI